ncbi:hypothetical protein CRE_21995 [Caenorhabditis remanei]|uniref:F-box domain-containing protein n=1 Tax=Caenorhabditis remanei TaxID=31234 RepID=E3N3I7_CAERE|nr:hypothetical protein CRE_21995 [Caenorhabditis remanei]
MPPLPLLRLPRLILCEVFKSLSISEKIKLSFCSKKTSAEINNARLYSQKVIVDLDILHQEIRVLAENSNETFEIFNCYDNGESNKPYIKQYRIAGCTVPVICFTDEIEIFWKNHREGFLSVTQQLFEMFQCKISTYIECYLSVSLQPALFDLFDLQLEFKTLIIFLNGKKGQNVLFNQISSNFGLVKYLSISCVPDPGFQPVFTSWPQKIIIWNSAWFTLQYLLACTCTTITLEESHLGNKDLNEILKNWKAGEFPNLERLKIISHNITNNGTTILGMNLMELVGMVIQTNDGSKKATLRVRGLGIEMSVTPFD